MNHRSRTTSILAVLALAALVLVGCGSSSSDGASSSQETTTTAGGSATTAGGAAGTKTVVMKGMAFNPPSIKAKVGDTITFKNEDEATHTGTTEKGAPAAFDTGDLKRGESKEVKVAEAGTYDYECTIHDYMKGKIEVSQ